MSVSWLVTDLTAHYMEGLLMAASARCQNISADYFRCFWRRCGPGFAHDRTETFPTILSDSNPRQRIAEVFTLRGTMPSPQCAVAGKTRVHFPSFSWPISAAWLLYISFGPPESRIETIDRTAHALYDSHRARAK